MRPERSDESQLAIPRGPQFDKNSPYDGDRRKGVSLEIVPGLKKSARPRHPRVGGRGEVDRKSGGQGCCKKVNHRRPFVDQVIDYLLMESPLGPDHLIGAAENVRCDIG